jgi:hypothetical protein
LAKKNALEPPENANVKIGNRAVFGFGVLKKSSPGSREKVG